MKYLIAAVALIAVAAFGIVTLNNQGGSPAGRESDGPATIGDNLDKIPDVELSDYDGNAVSLDNFGGKPMVVNSWAAWCPFCKQELPDFAALQREFPGIAVIAIDRAESRETAKSYTDELGISDAMIFLLDPGDDFYRSIGGFSMPETIFVNESGSIVFHKRGPLTVDEMRSAVRQFLMQ